MGTEFDNIPDTFSVSNNTRVDIGLNIKIDLSTMDIKNILNYILNYLKNMILVDIYFEYNLLFDNKKSLVRFEDVLYRYNRVIKLYIYNTKDLSEEDNKLLDLLCDYKSIWFSAVKIENKFTKTELNYRNASPEPNLKQGEKVNASIMARLDNSIRKKCKNNNPKQSRDEVNNPTKYLAKELKRN